MIKFIQKTPFEVLVDLSLFPDEVQSKIENDKSETILINTLAALLESDSTSDQAREAITKILDESEAVKDDTLQAIVEKEPTYFEVMSNEDYKFKLSFLLELLKGFLSKELKIENQDEKDLFVNAIETLIEFLEADEVDNESDFEEVFTIYKNIAADNIII